MNSLQADPTVSGLVGNRVYTSIPGSPSWPLIRITRFGGTADPVAHWIDRPRIQVEAWAETQQSALEVAQAARRALHNMPGTYALGVVTHSREVLGPQWLPDPATNRARYLFDIELVLHPLPA